MTAERFTVDSDGKWWDTVSKKYVSIDHLFYLVEKLEKEVEQLKKENEKLNFMWEDKCIKEYMKFVGENALQEMHNEKYGEK